MSATEPVLAQPASDPVLDTVLRPSPPMPPRALLVILSIVAFMNLCFAGYFLAHGAWPVTPFMGLDVALLAWAFQASVKASRREEQLILTREQLRIVRRTPGKATDEYRLNPYWVRVAMDESPDHARVFHGAHVPQAATLTLWSHGKGLTIGGFLSPMVRARVGSELKSALSRLRGAA